MDELILNSRTIAETLAEKEDGEHEETLQEYLSYLEYIMSMKCTFTDKAMTLCDDKFRRVARLKHFSLDDK